MYWLVLLALAKIIVQDLFMNNFFCFFSKNNLNFLLDIVFFIKFGYSNKLNLTYNEKKSNTNYFFCIFNLSF